MVIHEPYPPGYRFRPTDEELVTSYLRKKVMNLPLPCNNKLKDVNIYKFHPQHLKNEFMEKGDKFMYFFSPRDRKYPQGNRPNRSAGEGFWKATGVDRGIEQNNIRIGTKKTLVYYEGKAKDHPVKTNWIMHEYRTIEEDQSSRKTRKPTSLYNTNTSPTSNTMMLDRYVLCKIYKRTRRQSENEIDDTDSIADSTSSETLMQSNDGSEYVSDNVGSTSIVMGDFTNFAPPLQGELQGSALYSNIGCSSFKSLTQTNHNVGFGGSLIPTQTTHKINVCPGSSVVPMQRTLNITVGPSSSVIPRQMNVGSSSSVIPEQTTPNIHVGSSQSVTPNRISHDNVGSTSFSAQLHEYSVRNFFPRPINHHMFATQGNHEYFNATPAQRTEESNGPVFVGSTCSTPATQGNTKPNGVGPTPRNVPVNSAFAPPMPRMDDGNMQDYYGSSNWDDEFDYLSFFKNDGEP